MLASGAGIPDTFILHRGIAHMTDIKTPAGELSDPQQAVIATVLASSWRVGVVEVGLRQRSGMQYSGHEGGTMRQGACIFVLPLCTRTRW